jgi:carbon monoxide dehydrogenase subunit G
VIIENEFSVGADIDTVWRELLDMEGVASCLPGATISATDQENVYDGSMRLKIGPMRVEYRGTATLSEVDEEHHTAVISLRAREAKGQGSAMATIRNRLESVDGGTRVSAQTDLQITGPQAQFGRGVIEDVGKRVLAEFSHRLEQRIAGGQESGAAAEQSANTAAGGGAGGEQPGAATESAGAQAGAGGVAPAELDVGALVTSSPIVRRVGAGALALALVALALIVLRRRR